MDGETNMKTDNDTLSEKRANSLTGREWLQSSFSIWRGLGKTQEEKKLAHPAIFTVRLVSKLLEAYTHCNEDEILLDPFAGSGTALLAAMFKHMKSIGLDINEDFRNIFASRASSLINKEKYEYHVCDAQVVMTLVL